MSTKGTYFRVGIFVILASVIGIAAIIVFGAAELIPRKAFEVETYMDDSVQGLEVGSKVKSHGVEIGKVEEITFADSEYQIPDDYIFEHGRFVLVRMHVYPELIGEASGKLDMDIFNRAIEAGMRVRLASAGLTGGKFMEVEFLDAERFPPFEITWEPNTPYIPSAPGVFASIMDSVDGLTRQLETADFKGLVNDVRKLVNDIDTEVKKADIEGIGIRAKNLLEEFDKLAKNPDLLATLQNLNEATGSSRDIVNRFDQEFQGDEFQKAMANIRDAMEDFPEMMQKLTHTMRRVDNMLMVQQNDLGDAIRELSQTFKNLRELTDTAKKYPSWALFGKPPLESKPAGE